MRHVIAVVGGGFAGITVAQALDADAEVVLVDPRDAFVNVTSSLRALTRTDWAGRPFFRYDTLLAHGRVVRDAVTSVSPTGVELAGGGRLDADDIVLATGSSHSYPARPRLATTGAADAAADLRATHDQLRRAGRVLILGAGPVGLELSGEIRDVWPGKRITIVDPHPEVLPGYLPEVRRELLRQLEALDIDLRPSTGLVAPPPVEDATAATFTVTTTAGDEITADIWFRTFGTRPHTDYLADGALVELTARGLVPVDEHLNVRGHENVFALGDIADLPDAKMATHALTQAPTVIENLRARLGGRKAETEYAPASSERILLPLGARHGVGQLPTADGRPAPTPLDDVIRRKGADLLSARFAATFARS